jgi:hypothetical protein
MKGEKHIDRKNVNVYRGSFFKRFPIADVVKAYMQTVQTHKRTKYISNADKHTHAYMHALMSPLVVQRLACLPLDLSLTSSNLAEDDGFLKLIKIRNTTSF